ncbi:MAG: ORF6N domain-containing protein [Bacteroidetes bacterium]|nr:ORF6N domain-containing protein [Bacteroidota bacterium]MBU1677293.1 ORF6N domain-containing protein [Bacteroidota bacterium]MBU2505469.1 ORF6N domain-containing protein [Bacteroidota bacterium]
MNAIIPAEVIEQRIFLIRGEKVMVDRHLAELYGVDTRTLNQAVKRNIERFPEGFMFQLSKDERDEVITNCDNLSPLRFARTSPYAFTELGVAMLSSVLKSKRAIQVNIQIMKTFVNLRRMFAENKELSLSLEELEKKYDKQFKVVFDILNQLLSPEDPPKYKMGFLAKEKVVKYNSKKKRT